MSAIGDITLRAENKHDGVCAPTDLLAMIERDKRERGDAKLDVYHIPTGAAGNGMALQTYQNTYRRWVFEKEAAVRTFGLCLAIDMSGELPISQRLVHLLLERGSCRGGGCYCGNVEDGVSNTKISAYLSSRYLPWGPGVVG